MSQPKSVKDPFARALERALQRHFRSRRIPCPPHLAESIRYSLLAPGKRIRPRLVLASARMLGLPAAAALPSALALEMIHCFSLIHDDLPCMDDDDFRRGKPSNHKAFGEATALLAGDGLMCLAIDTALDSVARVKPARVLAALRRLSDVTGVRGMIGGQAAESALSRESSLRDLERMHAGKTGALFEAALLLPADLAGLAPKSPRFKALELFAKELGRAFQVADDLEDAGQDVEEKGDQDATSILLHMSRAEASSRTRASLARAQTRLGSAWGARSRPLIAIADEVQRALQ